ncbi:Ras guanine nucleotide exchange factor [Entamoeba marina]
MSHSSIDFDTANKPNNTGFFTPPRKSELNRRLTSLTNIQINEFIISNEQGFNSYNSLLTVKKLFDSYDFNTETGIESITSFIKNIVDYVEYLLTEKTKLSSIETRLRCLLTILFTDILNLSKLVDALMNKNQLDKKKMRLQLLTIEIVLLSLLHLENTMSSSLDIPQSLFPSEVQQKKPTRFSPVENKQRSFFMQPQQSKQWRFSQKGGHSNVCCIGGNRIKQSSCISMEEVLNHYREVLKLYTTKSVNWFTTIDNCKNAFDTTKLEECVIDAQQTNVNELISHLSLAAQTYFTGYTAHPSSFTHAFDWVPCLYNITKEDFFATLLHSINDDETLLSVMDLMQYWRTIPDAFSSRYMNSLYDIFTQLFNVIKQYSSPINSITEMDLRIDLPIITNEIWRIPPQYFYSLLHPRFVAQKLTEAHVTIFTKCQTRAIFYSKQMRRAGIGASDLKKKVDILAYWASQSLYESVKHPMLYSEFIEFFSKVISNLYYYRHNLLASLGLSIGFSSFRLNNLKRPQLRDDVTRTLEWVNEITDPKDGSYPNLIKAMKELGNPCIPYFGSFQNIFEKVLSADIKDVGVLYLNIGKATEETRRNRIKWSDLVYEDSSLVDDAFKININEYFETPWSDTKLFDSMVKSTSYRVFHLTENIRLKKHCVVPLLKTSNGFVLKTNSIFRYRKYAPLI